VLTLSPSNEGNIRRGNDAGLALYETVVCNPKKRHYRQKMNRKMKEERAHASAKSKELHPYAQNRPMQHICFCPKRTADQTKNILTD
jgi:hypothetical protein